MAACSTALSSLLVACLPPTPTVRQGRRISGQNTRFAAQPAPPHTSLRGLSLSPCRRLQCGQKEAPLPDEPPLRSRARNSALSGEGAIARPSWPYAELFRLFDAVVGGPTTRCVSSNSPVLSSQSGCPAGSTSPPSVWQSFKARAITIHAILGWGRWQLSVKELVVNLRAVSASATNGMASSVSHRCTAVVPCAFRFCLRHGVHYSNVWVSSRCG